LASVAQLVPLPSVEPTAVSASGTGDQLWLTEREPRLSVQIVAERCSRGVSRCIGRGCGRGRAFAGPPAVRQQQRVVRHLGRVVASATPLVVIVRVGYVLV